MDTGISRVRGLGVGTGSGSEMTASPKALRAFGPKDLAVQGFWAIPRLQLAYLLWGRKSISTVDGINPALP